MPELPDITIYIEALEKRILNHTLERVQLNSPFLLRTATPPIAPKAGFADGSGDKLPIAPRAVWFAR